MEFRSMFTTLAALIICQALSSQNRSETRNYIRTSPAGKETTLEVSNKYGTIQITRWKKDSVMIRSEVKAVAGDRDKLEKMFDGVNINMTESKYRITAETMFTQNVGRIFENFKGMTSKFISYDSKIEINYYISVPDYLNMKIVNRYGDVYMEDNTGDLSVTLSNGSFMANSLEGHSNLSLTFCDATISSMARGKIDASFSEFSIHETGDITINSISSKYEIKQAGAMDIESRRDKFYIDDIVSARGSSYFTDFIFGNLRKEATLSARYGNLDIDMIEKGFESVNLNTGYCDISLTFEQGSSYNFDIRHLNAFLVISDKGARTEKKTLNEDKKEYISTGTTGKTPGNSRVSIDATHGDIFLK